MSPQLRAALARLCRRHGWSYGVVWRVDRRDPRLLVMEDSYCEEQVRVVVEDMLNQVCMVGEGIVGGSVISGKDKWIYHDAYGTDSYLTGSADNQETSQAIVDLMHQFLAGIKTIVISSLSCYGVVQFGSTNKIPESSEFIDQAKHLFQLIGSMSEPFSSVDLLKETKFHGQCEAFASTISGGVQSFHGKYREQTIDTQSLTGPSQSSIILPVGPSHGLRPHHSVSPHALSKPATSTVSGASVYFRNPLQKPNSCSRTSILYPTIQDDAASGEAHVLVSPSLKSLPSSDSPDYAVATCINPNSWPKIPDLPIADQRLLSGMGALGCSNLFHTDTSFPVPCNSTFPHFAVESSSSSGQYQLQDSMPEARYSLVSNGCLSGSEKLPLLPHYLYDAKPICDVPSFAAELLGTSVVDLQDSTPERSLLLHTRDEYLIHLTDQQPECVSYDGITMHMNEKQLAVSSASSNFAGSDAIGCNTTKRISNMQVEQSSSAINSLVLGGDDKENFSIEPAKLLFDGDLFGGMELDLSTNNYVQQYWDDIIMPARNGNCSNLSVSVSECLSEMQMGSTSAARKGLHSESGLEQLLDAIVGQTINEGSVNGCLAKNVHPIAHPDLENQFSMVTNGGGPSVHRSQVPSVCLPSTSQTSNALLPHCISDIIHGSMKEATPKSNVSSWIDDCCSMNNESVVLNQPKKPEEAAKIVKKRARPGESTRPRPKDRQQIQDRVKELRDIVPNGAKCSIDALLDRTIKHMLFLQCVTKYADKLKQDDEPKVIVEESGVVLKDNSNGSSSGGATWAYEVAGQTMVCPIMVEDLTPPGQMLVEMLCEERGIFLEIADIIRGFGLTILKGVMETRECKIWARFLVEANRDVTRLDIFLSLVQLLQQTSSAQSSELATKVIEKEAQVFKNYQQSPISVPITSDGLQ